MKLIFQLLAFFISGQILGQTSKPTETTILSNAELAKIFTDSVKKAFNISYTIYRVYNYADKAGNYYIVLTEKTDSIIPGGDTLHHKIRALALKGKNVLEKQWEINDFILPADDEDDPENSIWFWTKYSEFNDIDNDGLVDPILMYGTSRMNGISDGRLKILIFYKGEKSAIRHQNSTFDGGRSTQTDESFFYLPKTIQIHVRETMQKMVTDKVAIFPYGWEN